MFTHWLLRNTFINSFANEFQTLPGSNIYWFKPPAAQLTFQRLRECFPYLLSPSARKLQFRDLLSATYQSMFTFSAANARRKSLQFSAVTQTTYKRACAVKLTACVRRTVKQFQIVLESVLTWHQFEVNVCVWNMIYVQKGRLYINITNSRKRKIIWITSRTRKTRQNTWKFNVGEEKTLTLHRQRKEYV